MKSNLVSILFLICCTLLYSHPQEIESSQLEVSRSIFSVHVGYAFDLIGARGYSAFIKSSTFIGESPFYYGFGSLLGGFTDSQESFFETGVLAGYRNTIKDTDLSCDVFLDLLIIGGRVGNTTLIYEPDSPALHLGISLGFPASSGIGGALSIAPVIRPYARNTGLWDFSRSYINLSLVLSFKSRVLSKAEPWKVSNIQKKGELL